MSYFIFKKKKINNRQKFVDDLNKFLYGKLNEKISNSEIIDNHLNEWLLENDSNMTYYCHMSVIIQSLEFRGHLWKISSKSVDDFAIAFFSNKESGINFICDPTNLFDIDGILLQ